MCEVAKEVPTLLALLDILELKIDTDDFTGEFDDAMDSQTDGIVCPVAVVTTQPQSPVSTSSPRVSSSESVSVIPGGDSESSQDVRQSKSPVDRYVTAW